MAARSLRAAPLEPQDVLKDFFGKHCTFGLIFTSLPKAEVLLEARRG